MNMLARLFPGRQKALSPVRDRGWRTIFESFAGAWQRNIEVKQEHALAFAPVFGCVRLISGDIGKLRIKLVRLAETGIWIEAANPAYNPVLRSPNGFQNRIQFVESWVTSKLLHGNTYVLKQRDGRNVVTGLFVLDPQRVKPLVSTGGDVFYELAADHLSGIVGDSVIVPAAEIIHDRWNCLYHPLVGISPLYAAGLPAVQGHDILSHSIRFFRNGAQPSGVLTAPGEIDEQDAKDMAAAWRQNFGIDNPGSVAVLSDGLKYEVVAQTAHASQLVEQLKLSAEQVCTAFGVPPYKIGIGNPPAADNIQALQMMYYQDCLHPLIEAIELCLDEGTGMDKVGFGTELETENLLRMDTATLVKAEAEAVKAGIKAPNESRKVLGLPPVTGGETPYLQQQNFSLAALAERDADKPFAKPAPANDDPPAEEPSSTERAALLSSLDIGTPDNGRTIVLAYDEAGKRRETHLCTAMMIYRGVWAEGAYDEGDTVTHGGSLWHCNADGTTSKPGDEPGAWTLAVKRGRDAK